MKKRRIASVTRFFLLLCGLGLIVVLFTPLWRIDLQAPQYPEGLRLLIYPNKLAGNVDIINGLNHYIGMKTLHTDDFPEFKILPGIIIFFAAFFMITAFAGKRKWMNILFIVFVAFGIIAMIDFWRWEYNYGHNLDPNAAIIVPGMAYQPPLIGFKQLLNFGAYSVPDIGGWIFVACGMILLCGVVYEWRRRKQIVPQGKLVPALVILLLIFILPACSERPQPIRVGRDQCDFCKMTISDNRFGAEIITNKGKIYKFDDAHCILKFLDSKAVLQEEIAGTYFTDFSSPHALIKAERAHFLQSPGLKSPMNGNIASFSQEDSLVKLLSRFYGNKISWEDMQK
jgi:copper chaperone NosL